MNLPSPVLALDAFFPCCCEAEDVDWSSVDQVAQVVSRTTMSTMQQIWRQHANGMDDLGRAYAERMYDSHSSSVRVRRIADAKGLNEEGDYAGRINSNILRPSKQSIPFWKCAYMLAQPNSSVQPGIIVGVEAPSHVSTHRCSAPSSIVAMCFLAGLWTPPRKLPR